MPRPSFSTQLYALWILIAVLCSLLTASVWLMLSSALGERVADAKQQAATACAAVASRDDMSVQRPGETNVDLMHAVLDLILIRTEGIEGGFWTSASAPGAPSGFLAYAFPTYEGSGVKRDIPEAETPLILRTLRNVVSTGQMRADVVSGGADAVVAVACPVPRHAGLFAWMLTRARPPLGPYGERAATFLASVLAIIVALALLLAMALRRWKRNLTRLEQNAENAQQASSLSANASEVALKGNEVVSQVVGTMGEISTSSTKIAEITGIIEGIAFQTNILALNAAVEAARAGEQGRGFAVVASEVRSLAQRSSSAAKEIKDLINASVQKIHDGSLLANQAGKTMSEVTQAVARVTDIMGEIAAASTEQSRGIEQVNQSITQMDEVAQQNAALVEEAAAASKSLEDQGRQLNAAISFFRLDASSASLVLDGQASAANRQMPRFLSA